MKAKKEYTHQFLRGAAYSCSGGAINSSRFISGRYSALSCLRGRGKCSAWRS